MMSKESTVTYWRFYRWVFLCAFCLAILTIYSTGFGIQRFKHAFSIQVVADPEIDRTQTMNNNFSSKNQKSSSTIPKIKITITTPKHKSIITSPEPKSSVTTPKQGGTNTISRRELPISDNQTSKLIVLWSPFYRSVKDLFDYFTNDCPQYKCKVTANRSDISKADAVLFEADSLGALPKKSKRGQVWIYTDMESPAYRGTQLANFNSVFNWTISFRRDSDIPFYYGNISKIGNKSHYNESMNLITNKTNKMLWMVSHCETPSKREEFVKELKQFLDADIIGRCGNNTCNREQKCEQNMLNRYKFYFGAENADCKDYITEKAFRTLMYPIIPVLRGGYNYSIFLPPSSYLDTHGFSTVNELSSYMKMIDNNAGANSQYFNWKLDFVSSDAPTKSESFCLMCMKLQNQHKFRRLYRNINDWWRGNEKKSGYFCPKQQLRF